LNEAYRPILNAEDAFQILNLYARYGQLADGKDAEAYAACYAESCRMVSAGILLGSSRQQVAMFRKSAMTDLQRLGIQRRHFYSGIVLEAKSTNVVSGRCYLRVYNCDGKSVTLTHMGTSSDQLVREGSEWKFLSRELEIDYGYVDWA
jgi:3-phenylpropionate/cinnamic acid dioxygenase small subunit